MNIIRKNTPNFTSGRSGQVPIMIVCHTTCGSFDGAVSWLCNKESKASSHFLVAKDGRVVQLVDIAYTAWCNGTNTDKNSNKYVGNSTIKKVREKGGNANNYTISIEFEGLESDKGKLTKTQLETAIELIEHIKNEVKRVYNYEINYTTDEIVGHCHLTPKWKPNCPGKDFPFLELIKKLNSEEEYNMEIRKFDINNKKQELDCIVIDGVTYTPIRTVAEQLGATVVYDKNTTETIIKTK